MPQIIMLGHAAWVNHERLEERVQRKSGNDYSPYRDRSTSSNVKTLTKHEAAYVKRKRPEDVLDPYAHHDPVVLGDKHLSELSTEEFAQYISMPAF